MPALLLDPLYIICKKMFSSQGQRPRSSPSKWQGRPAEPSKPKLGAFSRRRNEGREITNDRNRNSRNGNAHPSRRREYTWKRGTIFFDFASLNQSNLDCLISRLGQWVSKRKRRCHHSDTSEIVKRCSGQNNNWREARAPARRAFHVLICIHHVVRFFVYT